MLRFFNGNFAVLIIACPCRGFGYPNVYNGWRWLKSQNGRALIKNAEALEKWTK